MAAKAATAIPIVFQIAGDPVREGLVASLTRPGGNATGAVNLSGSSTDAKAVEFLRELVPAAESLGLLVNPTNVLPDAGAPAAARQLRWEFRIFEASTHDDLKTAFAIMARQKIGAIDVVPDTFLQAVGPRSRLSLPNMEFRRAIMSETS